MFSVCVCVFFSENAMQLIRKKSVFIRPQNQFETKLYICNSIRFNLIQNVFTIIDINRECAIRTIVFNWHGFGNRTNKIIINCGVNCRVYIYICYVRTPYTVSIHMAISYRI